MAPIFQYRAPFDTTKVDKVEEVVRRIAEDAGFSLFEKDRAVMKHITFGKDAFFIGFYLDEDPVLFISNAGAGEIIDLSIMDFGVMSVEELENLASRVRQELKQKLEINLSPHHQ